MAATLSRYLVTLDDFLMGDMIGSGAFGEVYQGKRRSDNMLVAIKIMEPFDSESSQKSFIREVVVPGTFVHPCILPLVGYHIPVDDEHAPIIITKYIERGSLGNVIAFHTSKGRYPGTFTLVNLAKILYGVARAMAFLHAHDVIHRDLKPDNVLIGDGWRPYVADFGFSRVAKRKSEDAQIPMMTMNLGTPLFMAPELMQDDSIPYDTKVDVYAFAMTVFRSFANESEMIFENGKSLGSCSFDEFIESVREGQRFRRAERIPDACWELIQHGWDNNPSMRPTFEEICTAMENPVFALEPDKVEDYLAYVNEFKTKGPAPAPAKPTTTRPGKFDFTRKCSKI
jgi:serine/threonine protein kinase